jgi:hypothetical protein
MKISTINWITLIIIAISMMRMPWTSFNISCWVVATIGTLISLSFQSYKNRKKLLN